MGINLNQSWDSVSSYKVQNFEFVGQKGIEIEFNDGKKQMLTTKSTKGNVYASHDFDSIEAFNHFISILKSNGIRQV